jgi:hypothetical protein
MFTLVVTWPGVSFDTRARYRAKSMNNLPIRLLLSFFCGTINCISGTEQQQLPIANPGDWFFINPGPPRCKISQILLYLQRLYSMTNLADMQEELFIAGSKNNRESFCHRGGGMHSITNNGKMISSLRKSDIIFYKWQHPLWQTHVIEK